MELGETMELGDGRGSQLGEEDTPYIVEEQIQPLPPTQPAQRGTTTPERRYYRRGTRYYRRAPRYYRPHSRDQNSQRSTKAEGGSTAGAVLPLPLAVLPQGRDSPDSEKA